MLSIGRLVTRFPRYISDIVTEMPDTIANGTKIHWEEAGAGEPLLLIMGLGYTHDMWHRVWPAMAEHYRTIVFDNRGVGKSDVPPGPYTIAQMAGDAASVLDAAGVQRARVLGVSMGGMIAQEFALSYPNRVDALVLGCTTCGGRGTVPAAENVLKILMARATMTPEQGAEAMVPFIYDSSTPRERIAEDLSIRLRTFPAAAGYTAQLQAVMAFDAGGRIADIHARTLIIHGETDQLVPPENGRILASRIAGSRLVMLPRASHIFFTDQPDASQREILAFLR